MSNVNLKNAYCRAYQGVMRQAVKILDWTEPQILRGSGAVKKLPELIKKDGFNNVLVVTDKGLMNIHLPDGFLKELESAGIHYTVYDGVCPNPTIDNIEEARNLYASNGCQAVVAFGGGSPMDCAKTCAARIVCPNKSCNQMAGTLTIRKKLPKLYAVPTTAGTGSETTIAAVVTDPTTHAKYAIMDPALRPKVAVLDAELTVGLPPHITSTTGMDALTHAVEAYIGLSNTPQTRDAALKATKLIYDNIMTAYTDGKNIEARQNMLDASYLAGIAFTRAYVGYVHAIAHSLGGMYGTPHGLANAVVLPYVLEFYGSSAYVALGELADAAGLDTAGLSRREKAELFIDSIKKLNSDMNIPNKIEALKESDIELLSTRACKEGNPQYPVPRIITQPECADIYRKLLV